VVSLPCLCDSKIHNQIVNYSRWINFGCRFGTRQIQRSDRASKSTSGVETLNVTQNASYEAFYAPRLWVGTHRLLFSEY
jgi:hypothetical protein